MSSAAQDPFYIVKEEIQDSIEKLVSKFNKWELDQQQEVSHELRSACESIEWQIGELDKAISVAAKDPSYYALDDFEIQKRRTWTTSARHQVATIKKKVSAGKELSYRDSHLELMGLPTEHSHQTERPNQYGHHNDDFISSESDRQLLLIEQQDEELDVLSTTVQRIGSIGLTIHDELLAQEKIIDDLGVEMDSTSNRLDFLQKKVGIVMKKAGAKGQIMMLLFLVALFIVLFVLVFFT